MSIIATAVKHLIAAGVSGDDLVRAIAEMEAELPAARDAAADRRREKDRIYQANKRRQKSAESADSADEGDDTPFPAPAPSFPPDPQTNPTPTHTHGDDISRARKADFPKPDWADAQVWADFLANRKRKRLANTATAHKRFLADIAALADEEWPPGRLLEHAVARGWGAIFDPRNRNEHHVANRPDRRPQEPVDSLVRTVARRQAERAGRRLHEPDFGAGDWAEGG